MLPQKFSEISTLHKSSPSNSPLLLDHLASKNIKTSLRNTLEEESTKKMLHKRRINYFGSCEVSPTPSLSIKKEKLKPKIFSRCRPATKHFKIQVKQKTDCYNRKYQEMRGKRENRLNWIHFNITYGIYTLWNRMRKHLHLAQKITEEHQNTPLQINRFSKISKKIKNLLNFNALQTLNTFTLTPGNRRTSNANITNPEKKIKQISNLLHKNWSSPTQQIYQALPKKSKESEKVNQTISNQQIDLQTIKHMLSEFQSTVYLLENELNRSLDKGNKAISRSSPCILQLKKLQQILKQNQKRCSIIQNLLQKLEKISTEDQIQSSSMRQNKDEDEDEHNMIPTKVCFEKMDDAEIESTLTSALKSGQKFEQKNLTKKSCLLSKKNSKGISRKTIKESLEDNKQTTKKTVRILDNEKNQRASIELRIDGSISKYSQKNISYSKIKSKGSIKFKQSLCSDNNSNNFSIEGSSLAISRTSFKRRSKRKVTIFNEGRSQGKNIVVRRETNERKPSVIKKTSLKRKSKKGKNKKDVSITDIQDLSLRSMKGLKSMRSIVSMKSVKSLPSNTTFNSKQMIKSMRTQRDIKFLKGKLKKVSCVRNFKEKNFEMEEDAASQKGERMKTTENHIQEKKEQLAPLNNEEAYPSRVNLRVKKSEKKIHKPFQYSDTRLCKNINSWGFALKRNDLGNKKRLCPHKDQKNERDSAPIRQSLIEGWKLHKQLVYAHLMKLLEDRSITHEQFDLYKSILNRKFQQPKKTQAYVEIDEQEITSSEKNPYICLLELKKEISSNKRLSQINQYYYNFNLFKREQEQISKTKQKGKKQEQFFPIKLFTEPKQMTKHFSPANKMTSPPNNLYQKNI